MLKESSDRLNMFSPSIQGTADKITANHFGAEKLVCTDIAHEEDSDPEHFQVK